MSTADRISHLLNEAAPDLSGMRFYHGTNKDFRGPIVRGAGDRDANMDHGPGVYLTSNPEEADGYTGGSDKPGARVFHTRVVAKPSRILTDKVKATASRITKLIRQAPKEHQDEFAQNFGHEKMSPRAMADIVPAYAHDDSFLSAASKLHGDLFKRDSRMWMDAMHKVGYDGAHRTRENQDGHYSHHFVVYHPSAVTGGVIESTGGFTPAIDFGFPPPKDAKKYVDQDEYRKHVRMGRPEKSYEMEKPLPFPDHPVGTWRRDSFKGIHGHEIEQLQEIPIEHLQLPELHNGGKLDPTKRGDDEHYAKYLKAGHEMPPVHVVQTDRGNLRVTDGHRRVLAHKLAGRTTIKAWVSASVAHPEGHKESDGRPLTVALTHEIAFPPPAVEAKQPYKADLFHGTHHDFAAFSDKPADGFGHWMTDDHHLASLYGDRAAPPDTKGKVVKASVTLKNPHYMTHDQYDSLRTSVSKSSKLVDLRARLLARGHDGIVIPSEVEKLSRIEIRHPTIVAAFHGSSVEHKGEA